MSPSKLKRGRTALAHGSIFYPYDLTGEGEDAIEYGPRPRKRARVIDLCADEDYVKSDLRPVACKPVSLPRLRQARKFVIPEDDSDDEDFAETSVNKKEIEGSSMVTRSANREVMEMMRPSTSSSLAQRKVDPDIVNFIASITSKNEPQRASFTTAPTEIVLKILGHLKKVPAVVLSLTCKRFRRIYKDISPFAVGLNQSSDGQRLYMSLRSWVGPDYKYVGTFGIFVTHGHWARYLEEKRITAKILREMVAETKNREDVNAACIDRKVLRSSRAPIPTTREERTRVSRLHTQLDRIARGNRAEKRKRV